MLVSYGYEKIEVTGITWDKYSISLHQKEPSVEIIFETGDDTSSLVNKLFSDGYADLWKYPQRKRREDDEN